MSLNDAQARIKAQIWQAIAQSDLDVSCLPKETAEALVNLVTEAALVEIDDEMEKSLAAGRPLPASATTTGQAGEQEVILWEGRPFLSLMLHYRITDERIVITEGLLGKTIDNIELVRVQDIDYSQSLGERLINLGDINVRSNDKSHPEAQLKNVKNPAQVHDILRRAILAARQKYNVSFREEM